MKIAAQNTKRKRKIKGNKILKGIFNSKTKNFQFGKKFFQLDKFEGFDFKSDHSFLNFVLVLIAGFRAGLAGLKLQLFIKYLRLFLVFM